MLMFYYIAVRVLRNDMTECATGELGNIVVKCVSFTLFYWSVKLENTDDCWL